MIVDRRIERIRVEPHVFARQYIPLPGPHSEAGAAAGARRAAEQAENAQLLKCHEISPGSESLFRQHAAKLLFVCAAIDGSKPGVRVAHRTVPVDDHAGGHALNLESRSDFPLRIE